MPGTALDTSVIIPALLAWHAHHARALPVVQDALAAPDAALLPVPALLESYAVLTRLPPPWRLRAGDALALLTRTFRHRARLASLEGESPWVLLDTSCAQGICGGATHDAHVAACARAAGATTLATFNRRDFERLDLEPMRLLVP